MHRYLRKCGWLAGLLSLTACTGQLPPDYEPDYVRVPVTSSTPPYNTKYVLVPKACLTPDPTADTTLGRTLPPGCANRYLLEAMADKKGNLVQGSKLGPAPAGPAVIAAEKYSEGKDNGAYGGAVSQGVGTSTGIGTSATTQGR